MADNNFKNGVRERASTIRIRTWTLTLAIIIALIFYFLVTVTTKQAINWVDFTLLSTLQVLVYSIYFPDGDLYGQRNKTFLDNKKAYNEKAEKINSEHKIGYLREYCRIEYERRKQRYIENECGMIGITLEEFEILKQKSEKEIKKLDKYEFEYPDGNKLIFFSKYKRKKLYRLIFKSIPVEENHPETIMSAVENDGNKAIKDGSISYKTRMYIMKFFKAVVIGGVLAYIGYTVREGVGIAEITGIIMALTTLFTTAVMAFTGGEKSSRIYKSKFYLELSNFCDGFFEWLEVKERK